MIGIELVTFESLNLFKSGSANLAVSLNETLTRFFCSFSTIDFKFHRNQENKRT